MKILFNTILTLLYWFLFLNLIKKIKFNCLLKSIFVLIIFIIYLIIYYYVFDGRFDLYNYFIIIFTFIYIFIYK